MSINEDWQGVNFKDSKANLYHSTFNFGSFRQTSLSNPPKYLPYRCVGNFVGRQQELAMLHEKLQKPVTVAISAVAGMGGVGKTELAAQYAHRHQADYPGGICWLNAKESNLAAEIVQFAQFYMNLEVPQQLSLLKQVEWCWQNWLPPDGLVLIVLDDITNLKDWKNCQQILPTDNRFRLLITTRLRNLDADIQELPLDVLLPDKALELLTDLVGERRVHGNVETQNFASLLCEWLGYLPLGLQLVGRYLREDPDLSLAEILHRLQAQQLEDEAINPSTHSVKAAFELSWQELDPMTQRVGELLSLFAPDVIPWKLVESAGELLNWVKTDVNEAKKQLYKRHLIQRVDEKEGCYKIHPLIRHFLQAKRETSQQPDELKQAFASALVAIAQEIPESPTREFIESVQDAIPHLTEVAQNLIDAVQDEDLFWVFVGLGKFYGGQGLYALAEPWYEQCLKVVQARLGEEHLDVAKSLNNLALLYQCQGRYSEAESLYMQALALHKRLLEEEHPDVAECLNNLALLYYYQGRYSEAEPLSLQAIEIDKRLLGEENPGFATDLHNLALIYRAQERYNEAETVFLQALKLKQHLLPKDHPLLADTIYSLGKLYRQQGRCSEAEPFCVKALELDKTLLGENHPNVAESLNNLAQLYCSQGRYAEAELLYEEALEILQQVFEVNHPKTVTVRENLENLRTQTNASHENLTNLQGEKSASNSWFGTLVGLWR